LARFAGDVPSELERIVTKALTKDKTVDPALHRKHSGQSNIKMTESLCEAWRGSTSPGTRRGNLEITWTIFTTTSDSQRDEIAGDARFRATLIRNCGLISEARPSSNDDATIIVVDDPKLLNGMLVREKDLAQKLADGFESLWTKAMVGPAS
jgi:hypothetical protein